MPRQPSTESAFRAALSWVLSAEGGFVNDPRDPGGATNMGVSLRAVAGLRDEDGGLEFDLDNDEDVDAADIELLRERPDMVEEFYRERYWRPSGCDLLVWPASLLVMDAAVHSGPRVAVVTLQKALRVEQDGRVGPETATAAARIDTAVLARRFCTARTRFFRDLVARRPPLEVFFDGWCSRQFGLLIEAIVVRPK